MKRLLAGLVVFAAILLAGCTTPAPAGGGKAGDLPNTSWVLERMLDENGNFSSVPSQPAITLEIRDSTLGGSGGCNLYGGSYQVTGLRINISKLASTLRYCVDTSVDDREAAYLGLLGEARMFRVDGDSLRFFDSGGGELLGFLRSVPSGTRSLTGTRWVLESVAGGQGAVSSVIAGTEVDATFSEDGSVTGSAGCNSYFAAYTIAGNSLTLGPAATTKKFCGEPEGIMAQEQEYLGLLARTSGYGIEGDQLVLADDTGNGLLWFHPAPGS